MTRTVKAVTTEILGCLNRAETLFAEIQGSENRSIELVEAEVKVAETIDLLNKELKKHDS